MNVLTAPNAFLRNESDDPRLLPPALVVTVVALLGVALQYVLFSRISASLSNPETAGFFDIIMYVSMVFSFLAAYVGWFIYAGVFYLLSLFFEADGSFGAVFKLVGWGYVPSIFSAAVTAVAYFFFLSGDALGSPEGFAAVAQNPLNGPILWALSLVGVVFTLWQGALFAFAVKHGRNLTMKQAALVVSPVIVLSVGGSIFTVVSGLI